MYVYTCTHKYALTQTRSRTNNIIINTHTAPPDRGVEAKVGCVDSVDGSKVSHLADVETHGEHLGHRSPQPLDSPWGTENEDTGCP